MLNNPLDFDAAIQQLMSDPLVGAGDLAIWGGLLVQAQLAAFLPHWPLDAMPYRIWEYPDRIVFERDSLPVYDGVAKLDQGRLFGQGGDLSLRRDGAHYRWHFIGPRETPKPPVDGMRDFWDESPEARANPHLQLRERVESALLWGEYVPALARWHDDRVGWAKLNYPIAPETLPPDATRVRLDYAVYTNNGQVAFVWLRELCPYAERNR